METTHIPIHNPKVLHERMEYMQLRTHFNQLGDLENEETMLELTLPPFDPSKETYELFLELFWFEMHLVLQ
jgi:hypothetical protein